MDILRSFLIRTTIFKGSSSTSLSELPSSIIFKASFKVSSKLSYKFNKVSISSFSKHISLRIYTSSVFCSSVSIYIRELIKKKIKTNLHLKINAKKYLINKCKGIVLYVDRSNINEVLNVFLKQTQVAFSS